MFRFQDQELRMAVWRGRGVAKKAGLYMEEWLTALRFASPQPSLFPFFFFWFWRDIWKGEVVCSLSPDEKERFAKRGFHWVSKSRFHLPLTRPSSASPTSPSSKSSLEQMWWRDSLLRGNWRKTWNESDRRRERAWGTWMPPRNLRSLKRNWNPEKCEFFFLMSIEQLHTNIYGIRIQRIHRSYHSVEKCFVKECLSLWVWWLVICKVSLSPSWMRGRTGFEELARGAGAPPGQQHRFYQNRCTPTTHQGCHSPLF